MDNICLWFPIRSVQRSSLAPNVAFTGRATSLGGERHTRFARSCATIVRRKLGKIIQFNQ